MKANELMIGDLVRVSKDVCFKKGTIVKVRGIDADNVFTEKGLKGSATCVAANDPDRVTCGVWCDYLEPIPLTTEILEKNGFNILRDAYGMSDPFWSYSNRSVLVDVTIIRTNNVKVIDWFNVKISTRNDIKQIFFFGVKYVHQLQHALRLCEIEKEIVL